jgi:hypothetical protein
MANPFQGDDVDPFSGVRDEEGNIEREAQNPDQLKMNQRKLLSKRLPKPVRTGTKLLCLMAKSIRLN